MFIAPSACDVHHAFVVTNINPKIRENLPKLIYSVFEILVSSDLLSQIGGPLTGFLARLPTI